jgi:hypothetical protein
MPTLGGWDISELKPAKLPQKAATAFTGATDGVIGAEYEPMLYVGSQLVNGTNYCFIALQTIICAEPMKRLVKLIVNENGGKYHIVSVNRILKF